jgi:hypothetical protein
VSTETPLGKAARSARSTFSTMAATLPLCGYRASRPTFGSPIGSQAMVACAAAPWPGADGTASGNHDSVTRTTAQPRSQWRGYRCGGVNRSIVALAK